MASSDERAEVRAAKRAATAKRKTALRNEHLKRSELAVLFGCSPGVIAKLLRRPDFPAAFSISGDGLNMRYVLADVLAFRDSHRSTVTDLKVSERLRAKPKPPSAEKAVQTGLATLRAARIAGPTRFR